jgi:peptide/nickel transport system permease protein
LPLIPSVILVVVVVVALTADLTVGTILPGETSLDLPARYAPPWPFEGSTVAHLLGADRLGRDVVSRLVLGTRLSLTVGLTVVVIGTIVGTVVGIVAGYAGGWVDSLIMRIVDILLSFPAILVALALVVTVGPSFWMVVAVLSCHLSPQFARVIRADVLVWKERDFVVWARASGTPTYRILATHILPNIMNSAIVLATLQVGWVVLAEAALSFLGAGVPPPAPTLGNMLAEGRDVLDRAWWLTIFPGLTITLLVLSFNLLGDWLRDTFDPRLRQLAP